MAEFQSRSFGVAIAMDDAHQARIEVRSFLKRDLEGDLLSWGHTVAVRISDDLEHDFPRLFLSVTKWRVDVFAGVFPPSAAEDFPFGFFPAREDRPFLDDDRAIEAIGRHGAEHPFGEGLAADQHDLIARRIIADDVEKALQARAVGADRLF